MSCRTPRFGAAGKVPLQFLLNHEHERKDVLVSGGEPSSPTSPALSRCAGSHESGRSPVTTDPPCYPACLSSRKRWSREEDEILMAQVSKYGPRCWEKLAVYLPNRNGNQLRLRWKLHLSPNVRKMSYTPAEDKQLMELHRTHGNNWKLIVSLMNTSRSVNDVKNRYHIVSRRLRKAEAVLELAQ